MDQEYVKNDRIHAVGDSIVGRVRKANEDNCGFAETPNGNLFVVCDGMGGHVGGAVASRIAVASIIKYMSDHVYADIPQAIKDSLDFANREITNKAQQDKSLTGMGTTACILLINDQSAWISHIGDSRIYLYVSKEKTLHRITKDHSFVQMLVDTDQIDDREAESHPRKNIILKALGTGDRLVVDICNDLVVPSVGDIFMICSDGLSGMLNDNEIESIIGDEDYSLEDKLKILLDDANAPDKGKDNITVQLIAILQSDAENSVFPDFNPMWRQQKLDIEDFEIPVSVSMGTSIEPVKKNYNWVWWLVTSCVAVFVFAAVASTFLYFKKGYALESEKNQESIALIKDSEKKIKALRRDSIRLEAQKQELDAMLSSLDSPEPEIQELQQQTETDLSETKEKIEEESARLETLKNGSGDLGIVTERLSRNDSTDYLGAFKQWTGRFRDSLKFKKPRIKKEVKDTCKE